MLGRSRTPSLITKWNSRIVDSRSLAGYCPRHVSDSHRRVVSLRATFVMGDYRDDGSVDFQRVLRIFVVACLVLAGGSASAAPEKDGPMAKVSGELRTLYDEYLAAQRGGTPFSASDPLVRIIDDRVIVDAVASGDVAALEADLRVLGMQGSVSAGRMVSGQLPISAIGALSGLSSLRFVRAATSVTFPPILALPGLPGTFRPTTAPLRSAPPVDP